MRITIIVIIIIYIVYVLCLERKFYTLRDFPRMKVFHDHYTQIQREIQSIPINIHDMTIAIYMSMVK